jgi:hypothetical protein
MDGRREDQSTDREGLRRCAECRTSESRSIWAVLGLALGIVVSVTTEVPFAPAAGLALGGLVGWLSRWKSA